MPDLLKSAFLLERVEGASLAFTTSDDIASRREVYLDYATWDDLGRPDEITVTVEPGDTLNEEKGQTPLLAADEMTAGPFDPEDIDVFLRSTGRTP